MFVEGIFQWKLRFNISLHVIIFYFQMFIIEFIEPHHI